VLREGPLEKPFPAYKGDEPYVFVCYAHEDAETVLPDLQWLREQGFNFWYDEGISAGKVWRAEIAAALEGARQILFYISPQSLSSIHCDREINYTLDRNKPILPVYLQQIKLTDDLELGLSRIQAIEHWTSDVSVARERIQQGLAGLDTQQPPLRATQRSWLRMWAVALVAVITLGWLYQQRPAEPTDVGRVQLVIGSFADLGVTYRARGLYQQLTLNLQSYPNIQLLTDEGTIPEGAFSLIPSVNDGELEMILSEPQEEMLVHISLSTEDRSLPTAVAEGTKQLVESLSQRYLEDRRYSLDEDTLAKYFRAIAITEGTGSNDELQIALTDLKGVVAVYPRHLPSLLLLCGTNLRLHENLGGESFYEEAEKYCNRAATLDPDDLQVRRQLADLYVSSGLSGEAISLLTEIVRQMPYEVSAIRSLGDAFLQVGEMELAESYLDRAVFLEPGRAPNHSALGRLHWRNGEYAKATIMFRQAFELEDENPKWANNLAAALFMQGRWEESGEIWQQALLAGSRDPSIISNIGTSLFLLRNFNDATAYYIQAVELAPDNYKYMGNVAEAQYFACSGEHAASFERAIKLALQQTHLNPGDAHAIARLAVFHAYMEHTVSADELIAKALDLASGDVDVAYDAAVVVARLGRVTQSQSAIAKLDEMGYPQPLIDHDVTIRVDPPNQEGRICLSESSSHFSYPLSLPRLPRPQ
jgi:Flp pilus assembly protein TadD